MSEKLTIEATIPTVQYGNVRSSISLDVEDYSSWEDMRNDAIKKTKSISDMVAGDGYTFEVRGLASDGRTQTTTLKTNQVKTSELTGVSVIYDEDSHTYTDKDGNKYLSGSVFPNKFYPTFDSKAVIDGLVKKYEGVSGLDISNMWNNGGNVSTSFGTSIHLALENYDKYSKIGALLAGDDRNKALSKNPIIRHIVEKFCEIDTGNQEVMSEVFVANEEHRLCGMIDRLVFVDKDKKIVRIQDYKTDGDIFEKKYQVKDSPFKGKIDNNLLGLHFLQLSFYAYILEQAGYTVQGLDIFWLDGNKLLSGENPWEKISKEGIIDIKEGLK